MNLSPFGRRGESPITTPNPLSLAIPDATFDAWARELPQADMRRLASGQAGSRDTRTLAHLTVDDLLQKPRPWRNFFAIERVSDAYGLCHPWRETPARITENIYTYIGNYLRVALVLVLCVLYKCPLALLGIILTAKAWDWLRQISSGWDRQSINYKVMYFSMTILTWIVLVCSSVTVVLVLAGAITTGVTCFHAALRLPAPLEEKTRKDNEKKRKEKEKDQKRKANAQPHKAR